MPGRRATTPRISNSENATLAIASKSTPSSLPVMKSSQWCPGPSLACLEGASGLLVEQDISGRPTNEHHSLAPWRDVRMEWSVDGDGTHCTDGAEEYRAVPLSFWASLSSVCSAPRAVLTVEAPALQANWPEPSRSRMTDDNIHLRAG